MLKGKISTYSPCTVIPEDNSLIQVQVEAPGSSVEISFHAAGTPYKDSFYLVYRMPGCRFSEYRRRLSESYNLDLNLDFQTSGGEGGEIVGGLLSTT